MNHSFRLLMCLAASFLCLAGCQRSTGFQVKVQGLRVPREHPVVVEVTNWNGEVQVVANERYSEPEVRARARSLERKSLLDFEELKDSVAVRAISLEEGGKRVLRVTGTPVQGTAPQVALDLQIRVPKAWGLRVVNSGGGVEAVGVAGPITIQNGGPGLKAGDIEIRTGKALTEDVTLTTSEGRIHYQVGPGSTGQIDITATKGMPYVEAKTGALNSITYEDDRWRGNLANGKNRVSLTTHDGQARMLVLENAGEYGKEYWDGWPRWPTSPKWLARIGGN